MNHIDNVISEHLLMFSLKNLVTMCSNYLYNRKHDVNKYTIVKKKDICVIRIDDVELPITDNQHIHNLVNTVYDWLYLISLDKEQFIKSKLVKFYVDNTNPTNCIVIVHKNSDFKRYELRFTRREFHKDIIRIMTGLLGEHELTEPGETRYNKEQLNERVQKLCDYLVQLLNAKIGNIKHIDMIHSGRLCYLGRIEYTRVDNIECIIRIDDLLTMLSESEIETLKTLSKQVFVYCSSHIRMLALDDSYLEFNHNDNTWKLYSNQCLAVTSY